MSLQSGNWYGFYYDANEWSGQVAMALTVHPDGTLSGTAKLVVFGTDLGYSGSISGNVSGNVVTISILSSGPPYVTLTFTGFWEDISNSNVPATQGMFGILPPPSELSNDSAGGIWLLWPGRVSAADL